MKSLWAGMGCSSPYLLLAGLLAACGGGSEFSEVDCVDSGDILVHCGFERPEDMYVLPEGRLIVSEMSNGMQDGNISLFDPEKGTRHVIPRTIPDETENLWGQVGCLAPEGFWPHGIDLQVIPTQVDGEEAGGWQLLVINHRHAGSAQGEEADRRDAVEMFELLPNTDTGEDSADLQLVWRGCVEVPDIGWHNDVAGTRDGGFVITQMYDRHSSALARLWAYMVTGDTGLLLHYDPSEGLSPVLNSDGTFLNGVTIAANPDVAYVAHYVAKEVRALNFRTGELLGVVEIPNVDNLSWDGEHIWAASADYSFWEASSCEEIRSTCPLPFSIYRIDPRTLEKELFFSVGEGSNFGTASVAVVAKDQAGELDRVWLGSFLGDRIAEWKLQPE